MSQKTRSIFYKNQFVTYCLVEDKTLKIISLDTLNKTQIFFNFTIFFFF